MAKDIYLIGAAIGSGAQKQGCVDGPTVLQRSNILKALQQSAQNINFLWQEIIEERPQAAKSKVGIIADCCKRIADTIQSLMELNKFFAVIGGDHSCAIGTWSGAAAAMQKKGSLGLIWVDAHLDSHTPETSESGAIHGMPVAVLLGHGEKSLTQLIETKPKILPENLCIIGVRSYEKGEHDFLKRLGVKIFYMNEVTQRGFKTILQEAQVIANKNTAGYGISIDIDAIDPADAPGTGSTVAGGIHSQELIDALSALNGDSKLIGFEIAEFNPHLDIKKKTEKIITQLISAIVLGKKYE